MIIFYDKKSREVTGLIAGRLHSEHTLEKGWVGDKENTNKYVVPYIRKGQKTKEYVPDVPFASLINDFESGRENPHEYRVVLDKKVVVGFEKRSQGNKD